MASVHSAIRSIYLLGHFEYIDLPQGGIILYFTASFTLGCMEVVLQELSDHLDFLTHTFFGCSHRINHLECIFLDAQIQEQPMTILDVDRYQNILHTAQMNLFPLDDSKQLFEVVRILVSHVLQLSEKESIESKGLR